MTPDGARSRLSALVSPFVRSAPLLIALTAAGGGAGWLVARFFPPSHAARVTIRKLRPEADDPFEVLRTVAQFERLVRSPEAAAAALAAAGPAANGIDPARLAGAARVYASSIEHCMELAVALPDPGAATAAAKALADEGIARVHALRAAATSDREKALESAVEKASADLSAADARAAEWLAKNGYPHRASEAERLLEDRRGVALELAHARRSRREEETAAEKISELLRTESPFLNLDGRPSIGSGRSGSLPPPETDPLASAPRRSDRAVNPAHSHLENALHDAAVRGAVLEARIRILEEDLAAADTALKDAASPLPRLEIERERIELDRSLARDAYADAVRERDAARASRAETEREIEAIGVAPPFRSGARPAGLLESALAGALVGLLVGAFAAVIRSDRPSPAPAPK